MRERLAPKFMKTHLEFRSDRFVPTDSEEGAVNPDRWGRALAEHLVLELASYGFTVGTPYPEDWGWAVPIEEETFPVVVGCGHYEEYPDGFLVFIEPSRPYVRRLWRKLPTEPVVAPIAEALEGILRSTDGIGELTWWPGPDGQEEGEV